MDVPLRRILALSAMLALCGCSGAAQRSPVDEQKNAMTGGDGGGQQDRYCSYLSRRLAAASGSSKMTRTLASIYQRRCQGAETGGQGDRTPGGRYSGPCLQYVSQMAAGAGIPEVVLAAVVHYESRDRPGAVSRANCKGCGQLSRAVLKMYSITDPFDPRQNMRGTAAYLAYLHRKFDGVWARAIAAYNTGAGRIGRTGDLGADIPNRRYVCEVYRRIPGWKARWVERKLGCRLSPMVIGGAVARRASRAPAGSAPAAAPAPATITGTTGHPVLSQRWVHPLKAALYPTRPGAKFGARRLRSGKAKRRCRGGHCGVDIGEMNQRVYAILDGRVIKAARYDARYSGKHVVIAHGPDQSVYCHLDRLAPGLRKGQRVKAGQHIGWVGRTGIKYSGAHLHLNVLVGKVHVDPEPMLRRARLE